MPGKHVHFARTNPVPSLHTPPALTYSPRSPASSASLLSPTSINVPLQSPTQSRAYPGLTPYTRGYPPSPVSHHKSIRMHPLLQYNHDTHPVLNFDLRDPPSTITSQHTRISIHALEEPATQPPLQTLTITIPHLSWVATVYPSKSSRYVSVYDVLVELYHMLRTNISADDFNALSLRERREVTEAYEQRYRRFGSYREYEDEKRSGVKRVDFLMGRTRFKGLETRTEKDGLVLHSM